MSYLYLFFNKKKIDKSIPFERLGGKNGFNSLFAALWESWGKSRAKRGQV